MTAIVTGAGGFLGRHVVARLRAEGQRVIAIDDLSTPGSEARVLHGVRWRIADLTTDGANSANINELSPAGIPDEPITEIWHLASPASPPLYKARQRDTLRLGGAVLDLLLATAERHGARLLFASSSEVYGDPAGHGLCLTHQGEEYRGNVSCTGPRSSYDEAKRYGEAMCCAWTREAGVDTRIARIFNTYGPGMARADGRVVSALIGAALSGEVFPLHAGGAQTRSFSYVSDTVDGLFHVMRDGRPATPVNVGSPHEMTIGALVEFVGEVLGVEIRTQVTPAQDEHDPSRRCPDLRRLRALGWTGPKVRLEDGIRATADWMRSTMPAR